MSFLIDSLSTVAVATALVGAAAFLAKALVKNQLSKDIEGYKRDLQYDVESHKAALILENSRALDSAKFEFEKELILHRGDVDLVKEGYKYSAESQKQRHDRLRAQVQRWALPIQSAISDLSHRIHDIMSDNGYVMLSSTRAVRDGWSANYEYFMPSTLYYFAQYFCWTRLLQQQLGHELFNSSEEMATFFNLMNNASDSISRFPYDREKGDLPDQINKQVFKLQQRAIGELLVSRTADGESIQSYREFLDRWTDKDDTVFARHISPLQEFLLDLSPVKDQRWERLLDLNKHLAEFGEACQQILQPHASDD